MSERDRKWRFERFCAEIFSQLLIDQSTERKKEKEKEEKEQEGEEEEGEQEGEGEQGEGVDEDRLRKKEETEEDVKQKKNREPTKKLEKQNSELSFTQGEGGVETLPSCSVDVKRMRASLEAEIRRVRVQTVDDFVETQLQVSCR